MTEKNLAQTNINDLVPAGPVTIDLPALTQKEQALAVIQENLAGMDAGKFQFDKVKIPAGGGISFEVFDDSGEAVPVKELTGVVLDYYAIKAWWAQEFTGGKNPPDCSSMDGKTGAGSEDGAIPAGQQCKNCPYNQWGSDPKGGRGKACKDIYRIYILRERTVFPVLLALPPTSLNNWEKYVRRLTDKLIPYSGVVTTAKLVKDKNEGGIEYSKVTFAKTAELAAAERKDIKEYIAPMRGAMRSVAIDDAEYNTEPAGQAYQDLDDDKESAY